MLPRVLPLLPLRLLHSSTAPASAAEVAAAPEVETAAEAEAAAEEAAATAAEAVASSQGVRLLRKILHSNMDVRMRLNTTAQSMVVRMH